MTRKKSLSATQKNKLSALIKKWCKDNNAYLSYFAEKAGLSYPAVTNILKRKIHRPHPSTLKKLGKLIDIPDEIRERRGL